MIQPKRKSKRSIGKTAREALCYCVELNGCQHLSLVLCILERMYVKAQVKSFGSLKNSGFFPIITLVI